MKTARLMLVLLAALLLPGSGYCLHGPATARLALLGDLMLSRGVNPAPDSLAYITPYLKTADLALANLESPLTPNPLPTASGYDLCTDPARAGLLAGWGLDLLSIANNHRDDCGGTGPAETRHSLETAGITPLGPGMEPVVRQVNGLRLAFFAFDDISSPLDDAAALQAIRSAHQEGSTVIVSIHWGMEYQGGASERQKKLAQEFVEAGAALIWGHHPHVLQPCEGCEPSSTPRPVIFFSLGNTLFDQGGLSDTRQSALVLATLEAGGVTEIRIIPFVINPRESRILEPDGETASKILDRLGIP